MDTSSFDANGWFSSERSEHDKGATLDIVRDDSSACHFSCNIWITFNDDSMFEIYRDLYSEWSIKINEIDHVWLYRGELDRRFSASESSHHDDIFCRSNGKIGPKYQVLTIIFSLKSDIFSFSHILKSECKKCI